MVGLTLRLFRNNSIMNYLCFHSTARRSWFDSKMRRQPCKYWPKLILWWALTFQFTFPTWKNDIWKCRFHSKLTLMTAKCCVRWSNKLWLCILHIWKTNGSYEYTKTINYAGFDISIHISDMQNLKLQITFKSQDLISLHSSLIPLDRFTLMTAKCCVRWHPKTINYAGFPEKEEIIISTDWWRLLIIGK